MHDFHEFLTLSSNAVHKAFSMVIASGVAGLIGCGAFAIGRSIGDSTDAGIALAVLLALPVFSSMVSMPEQRSRESEHKAQRLQPVFSTLV